MSRRRFPMAPPSPVPAGKGLRSSAINDKILSDFLTASLQIPNLKLPVSFQSRHLLVSPVDYRSTVPGDCDAIESAKRSASEFGFFEVNGHGVSMTEAQAFGGGEVRQRKRREAGDLGFDFCWAGEEDEETEFNPDMDFGSESQVLHSNHVVLQHHHVVLSSLVVLKCNVDYQLSGSEAFLNDEGDDNSRHCENESAIGLYLYLPSSKCEVSVHVGAESFVFQAGPDTIVAVLVQQLEINCDNRLITDSQEIR